MQRFIDCLNLIQTRTGCICLLDARMETSSDLINDFGIPTGRPWKLHQWSRPFTTTRCRGFAVVAPIANRESWWSIKWTAGPNSQPSIQRNTKQTEIVLKQDRTWQNYIIIWVQNCFGNDLFSIFLTIFSARFPCYLQHFGAGNCQFNCLCNILELEPLI